MRDAMPLRPEVLLEHAGWVRALAGRLLADAASADDATQETLVVALGGGPGDVAQARPWLASVLRNVVRHMRRASGRRDERERAVAKREALEATDEIVARAALQRAVVDAVLALAEPYRTTVLMRFFDEVPTGEIAKRRGEPVETVRTRLKRGLALLREKLARELDVETSEGRRRTGLGALVMLVGPVNAGSSVATSGVVVGGMIMTTGTKLVATAIVIVVGSLAAWNLLPKSTRPGTPDVGVANPTRSSTPSTHFESNQPTITSELAPGHDAGKTDGAAKEIAVQAASRPTWIEKLRAELTANNLDEHHVGDDLGSEARAAFDGMRSESFDLDGFLTYISTRLRDAWVVPDSLHSHEDDGKWNHSWEIAYENSSNGVSIARLQVASSEAGGQNVRIELQIHPWATEIDPKLDLTTSLKVGLYRTSHQDDSLIGGQIGIVPEFGGETQNARITELEKAGRLNTLVWVSTSNGDGRLKYQRTAAGRALTSHEIELLHELFRYGIDQAQDLSKLPRTK